MTFRKRVDKSKILIELLTNCFWETANREFGIIHEPWGYENTVSSKMQDLLKKNSNSTAKYIRFQPDFIVMNRTHIILMEYKVTSTPRYSEGDKQWNIGQIEADAWETYLNLIHIGVDINITIYCPYHHRPLLCDNPQSNWEIRKSDVKNTYIGSGTPYININLGKLKTFEEFMLTKFEIPLVFSKPKVNLVLDLAQKNLPVEYNPSSPQFGNKNYKTGWNWTLN